MSTKPNPFQKLGFLKAPTSYLVGSFTVVTGLFLWVKTKNDKPALWYRYTHKETDPTPLDQPPKYTHSTFTFKGKNEIMNDFGSTFKLGPQNDKHKLPVPVTVLGVFSGKNGSLSSNFVAKTFPSIFASKITEKPNSVIDEMKNVIETSLVQSYNKLDGIKEKTSDDNANGVVCVLSDKKMWTATVGDSKAVISRARRAYDLTGTGDKVNIIENTLYKEDEFVIIGSDGLWKVFSSEEAVDFVHQLRHINRYVTVKFLAQALAYEASEKKSRDNIVVSVILFEEQQKEKEEEQQKEGQQKE